MLNISLFASAICFLQPSQVTAEDIAKGLADAEEAIQSFSLTCKVDFWQINLADGKLLGPSSLRSTYILDNRGRVRYESDLVSNKGPGQVGPIMFARRRAVFDGERLKMEEGDRNRFERGLIASVIGRIGWSVDPREFTKYFSGKPIIEQLQLAGGPRILGRSKWEESEIGTEGFTDRCAKKFKVLRSGLIPPNLREIREKRPFSRIIRSKKA